jgi:LPXTG-motif cell wall-anchored protein
MRHRRLAGAALGACAAIALVAVAPASAAGAATAPAAAVPNCTTVTHTDTTNLEIVAEGTAVITTDTLRVTVPTQPSKVTAWFPTSVDLDDVTGMTYEAFKHTVAVGGSQFAHIAYKLRLDLNGDPSTSEATLIYEPYWQTPPALLEPPLDTWQVWDAFPGRFWSTTTFPGIVGSSGGGGDPEMATLAELKAEAGNADAKVIAYGFGLGSYNEITDAELRSLTFGAGGTCTTHVWAAPVATTPPAALSNTGVSVSAYVAAGAGLVLLGTLFLVLARRRRTA